MIQVNIKPFLNSNYYWLKLSGVWIKDSHQIKPKWYNYYSFIAFLSVTSFHLSIFINLIEKRNDLVEFAKAGFILTGSIMSPIKQLMLLRNKNGLVALFEQLDNRYFQVQDLEEQKVVEKKLQLFKNIKNGLSFVGYISVLMTCIAPLFYEIEQGLIVPAWYPINVSTWPAHPIAYIHQVVAFIFIAIGFIHADLLMGVNCTFIGLQCTLLTIRLKKIGNNGIEEKETLYNCVKHHLEILGFYKIVNNIFGIIFCWQVFFTTICICMELFLFNLAEPGSFESIVHLLSISAIGNFLLLPCLFASEMTTKSEALATAAFSSNWTGGSDSYKKDLSFLIFKSQKPLVLSVGGFFEMSKDTFVTVARASVSYYTVLNNLNSSTDLPQ